MWNRQSIKKINFSFLLMLFCGLCPPVTAATTDTDVLQPQNPLVMEEKEENTSNFEYILEGRRDPFTPFLTEKASTPQLDPDEIIDLDTELTGMRKFEPGQLTLVAVLEATTQRLAMVEDVTGRGYILTEGTLIGRHGVVTQIEPQQVLITETAKTRAGKEIKNTVVMRLKKEGEQ